MADHVGVVGLGLVGQLAVRILAAAGCSVVGVDLDPAAVALARDAGATALQRSDPALEALVAEATGGLGLDAVLVCAAADSTDPLDLAARLARDRGTLVVVGDVPIEVRRDIVYAKELELRIARSYGPGRYNRDYEERGRDLPAGYVRWTEQRNLQAFVDLIASGALDPSPLTTHRFDVENAAEAYALLTDSQAMPRPVGVLLEYEAEPEAREVVPAEARVSRPRAGSARIGLIGAGSFARGTLLPALKAADATLVAVASETGLSAVDVAARFGFERAARSPDEVIDDDDINAVVIATRHGTHATLATAALAKGKAVFVEKPLALHAEELDIVANAADAHVLMVGFNRRFAPLTEQLQAAFGGVGDCVIAVRVNAGPLLPEHWLHDPEDGGGRLLGEGCHFVDLLGHLARSRIVRVHAEAVPQSLRSLECSDSVVATVHFAEGGVGTLVYSGGGDTRLPKERIEMFGAGTAAVLEDFSRLEIYHRGARKVVKKPKDKGHRAEIARFVAAVRGTAEPPSLESYLSSSRATLALVQSLRTAKPVELR